MKIIYQSKSKATYDSADLALCDDAIHSDFQMFTETGEPCVDVTRCVSVWCPTPESVAQFNELRLSAQGCLNIGLYGTVGVGFNYYDDCAGEWFLVGTPSAMTEISATIIARKAKDGKGQ